MIRRFSLMALLLATGLVAGIVLAGTAADNRDDILAPPTVAVAAEQTPAAQTAERRPKPERTPLDVLDNPRLTLDKPADDGFDPYNTGAFNRSTSWERIGRQRKR